MAVEDIALKLLDVADRSAVVPLLVSVILIFTAKSLYGLHRSSNSDRKDFLEIFESSKLNDNLWLTVAVRNLYGNYLPVPIIRRLLRTPQPGRALRDVARIWELVDFDDRTRQITWPNCCYRTRQRRVAMKWIFRLAAFLALMCSVVLARALPDVRFDSAVVAAGWVQVALIAGLAYACFERSETLHHGGSALEKWLQIP